jgi:hypothetical protein
VDVGSVSDISKVYTASIFMADASWASQSLCIYFGPVGTWGKDKGSFPIRSKGTVDRRKLWKPAHLRVSKRVILANISLTTFSI